MDFIEFTTNNNGSILVKMENISVVTKNPREYPKFEITYSVFVGKRGWTIKEDEGKIVYDKYREWLMSSCAK